MSSGVLSVIERRRERDYERFVAYHEHQERARVYQDDLTALAETIDARLTKEVEFHMRPDGDIYSAEGVNMRGVYRGGVEFYKKLADDKPEYAFQYQRALAEQPDYQHMQAMVRDEAPNTRVRISTYPDELKFATEDHLGYQHRRKLGFVQILRVHNGRLSLWLQSFDRNDAPGIDAMYAVMDRSVDWSRDVHGQPIDMDLSPDDQLALGDNLLFVYDDALYQRKGGLWLAGRNEQDEREAIAFVEAQSDLMTVHVDNLMRVGPKSDAAKKLRYDAGIALRERFAGRSVVGGDVSAEMFDAGAAGRERGETVSFCGETTIGSQTSVQTMAEMGVQVAKATDMYQLTLRHGESMTDDCMQCPKCKNRGVKIEKDRQSDEIFYTCISPAGCGATTKPGSRSDQAPAPLAAPTLAEQAAVSAKSDVIRRKYGAHAVLGSRVVVVGGAYRPVLDEQGREIGQM